MEVVKNSYGAILVDKCPESKAELEENPLAVQFCLAMHSEISDVKLGKCIDKPNGNKVCKVTMQMTSEKYDVNETIEQNSEFEERPDGWLIK